MRLESIALDLVCSVSLPPRGYYRLAASGAGAMVGTIVETSGSGTMRGGKQVSLHRQRMEWARKKRRTRMASGASLGRRQRLRKKLHRDGYAY